MGQILCYETDSGVPNVLMTDTKGGRPSKYTDPIIDQYIAEELKNTPEDVSFSEIARRATIRLEAEGIEAPVDSAMRARVKKVRESGLK